MAFEKIKKHIDNMIENRSDKEREKILRGLQRFKMDMMKHLPFYGDILMKAVLIEDPHTPTAATDGRTIRYNLDFFSHLSEGERNYVFLHEVMHILLFHWKRKGDRDPLLWNIACDYVANAYLDRMKWEMKGHGIVFQRPANGCFIQGYYDGKSVEQFYNELAEQNQNRKTLIYYNKNQITHKPEDLRKAGALSQSEEVETERKIREVVKETIKRRGNAQSTLIPDVLFEMARTKRLPWHKLLYEFLQEREDEESSYLTPERKYIHMDLIIPGLSKCEDELGEIWAFVDSSGSISSSELGQFTAQLYRIASEFHCTFNVAYWDTEVTDVYLKVKKRSDILELRPHHSGGTDINCIYDYLKSNKINPEIMLILTDGYFGNLNEPVGKLASRTILVISENGREFENNNGIGKLARL